jgi:lipoprotein-anchoring transpeptidase ErfK/SrfK
LRPAQEPATPDSPPTAQSGERHIRVSLAHRVVEVLQGGVSVRRITNVSFGRPGHRTPMLEGGSLSLSRRVENYHSRLYAGAPMPHALFLEQYPGIAFHAGSTRAPSHGCIHLTPKDAAWLFAWAGREPVAVDIQE